MTQASLLCEYCAKGNRIFGITAGEAFFYVHLEGLLPYRCEADALIKLYLSDKPSDTV